MAKVSRLGVMNLRLCLNEADWLSKLAHLMRFHYYGSRIIFQTCLLDEAGRPDYGGLACEWCDLGKRDKSPPI